jgi:hypothetical protein
MCSRLFLFCFGRGNNRALAAILFEREKFTQGARRRARDCALAAIASAGSAGHRALRHTKHVRLTLAQRQSGVRTWGDIKALAPACIISPECADETKVHNEELDESEVRVKKPVFSNQ